MEPAYGLPHLVLRNRLIALVVDGDRFSQLLQRGLLHHYGVETQAVYNGIDAVDLLASGVDFDLILINKNLPVLDGLEATRLIRGMGITSKMLGLTACERATDRDEFLEAGVDEFTQKPLTPELLVEILRELDDDDE